MVAIDLFEEMVGEQYLQENYWKYLAEVILMMYYTAKLYSDMGKNVLIDGILLEREWWCLCLGVICYGGDKGNEEGIAGN